MGSGERLMAVIGEGHHLVPRSVGVDSQALGDHATQRFAIRHSPFDIRDAFCQRGISAVIAGLRAQHHPSAPRRGQDFERRDGAVESGLGGLFGFDVRHGHAHRGFQGADVLQGLGKRGCEFRF